MTVADRFYTGPPISNLFMSRWRSRRHVGPARPWQEVLTRRGYMIRSYHNNWPNPQFGQIVGRSIRHQWYPDWTPIEPWRSLPSVHQVDLDQNFDNNGITVATIDVDNEAWTQHTGAGGNTYHKRERGILWPWRGWTPRTRPGSGDAKNQWYDYLPYAQILVRQGYGPDTAVKTFTGLVDTFNSEVRPDHMTITCRDFGGILSDEYLFGWNKDRTVNDPLVFIPSNHRFLKLAHDDGKTHRWIVIKDACDVVRCCLRWAGFKEWNVEDCGTSLTSSLTVDKSKSYMDVINVVKEQLGYVFFMGEPTNDDLSIGVPVFRRPSVLVTQRSNPLAIRDQDLLTDVKPQHDNKDDRYIIRVRGKVDNKKGTYLDNPAYGGDTSSDLFKRVTFTYWPPWSDHMAGLIKQLTYYNVGDQSALGFTNVNQCAVACILIALQIALARDTCTLQTAGQPKLGLDSFAYVTDAGTGIASRVYITNRKSVMAIGGDGSSQQKSPYGSGGGSSGALIWATEIGGSLCDNPEIQKVISDYQKASAGKKVFSWSPDPITWDPFLSHAIKTTLGGANS